LYRTEGIVLRTRNLGEADKIVTLYTKTNGKVVAVARGARRIRNRLLGPTQVFTQGRYLIFTGKTLDTLSQGEIVNSFQDLREDLDKMAATMYLSELVDVLIEPGEASLEIYSLLLNTLKMLSQKQINYALRVFELRFAKHLGYEPQLNNCINCNNFPEKAIYFSLQGGVVCDQCRSQLLPVQTISRGTWELAKRILAWDWSRISILHPSEQSLSELEACMRAFYDYRLDKPLQSLDFIHTLKEFSPPEVKN